jgi:hypothetical protein
MFAALDCGRLGDEIYRWQKVKKEEKRRMKVMRKMKVIKTALALAAVLAMSGNGWAKQGGGGHGVNGDLNGDIVTLEVTVPTKTEAGLCDSVTPTPGPTPAPTKTYSIKAYIFQPSGRMFGIAIGYNTETFTCDTAADQQVDVQMKVFPGLSLKPGPATLLYQVTETTTTTSTGPTPTTTLANEVIYEYGYRIDLH